MPNTDVSGVALVIGPQLVTVGGKATASLALPSGVVLDPGSVQWEVTPRDAAEVRPLTAKGDSAEIMLRASGNITIDVRYGLRSATARDTRASAVTSARRASLYVASSGISGSASGGAMRLRQFVGQGKDSAIVNVDGFAALHAATNSTCAGFEWKIQGAGALRFVSSTGSARAGLSAETGDQRSAMTAIPTVMISTLGVGVDTVVMAHRNCSGACADTSVFVVKEAPAGMRIVEQVKQMYSGTVATPPVTVQLLNADGSVSTVDRQVITGTVVEGSATLKEAMAATESGVATFPRMALRGAIGNYTIRFRANGLPSTADLNVSLSAGAPEQFVWATPFPAMWIEGVAIAPCPAVQLADGAGNPVARSGASVSVVTSAGTELRTAMTDVRGTATLCDLALTRAMGSVGNDGTAAVALTIKAAEVGLATDVSVQVSVTVPSLSIDPLTLEAGASASVRATVVDSEGKVLLSSATSPRAFAFSTDVPAIATVDSLGVVNGARAGKTVMHAAALGAQGSASLTVVPATADAAASTLAIADSAIEIDGTTMVSVTVRDAQGNIRSDATASTFVAHASAGTLGVWSCSAGVCTAKYTAPSAVGSVAVDAMIGGAAIGGSPKHLTIKKKEQATLRVTATPAELSVGASATLAVSGGSGTGAVSFEVTSGADVCTLADNTLTGVQVGRCTVVATKAADASYDTITASLDVNVTQPMSGGGGGGGTPSVVASTFVLTGAAQQIAGASQAITVTAKDVSGNTATTFTGVQLLIFSGASLSPNGHAPTVEGTALGTPVAVTFTAGSATVNAVLTKRENATLGVSNGRLSAQGSDRLSVAVKAASAATMMVNAGDNQRAAVNTALAIAPRVVLTDAHGNLVDNANVVFAVLRGGGVVTPATVVTNADGMAAVTSWTMGGTVGANTLQATTAGVSAVTFTADATDALLGMSAPTGIMIVGQPLTLGSLTPNAATATYQWQSSADGSVWSNVEGATGSTYTLTQNDLGKRMRVVATGTGWYTGVVSSDATIAVEGNQSANLGNLVLSGSPSGFVFNGATYTYAAISVANGVESITVTPTGNGVITVDGDPVVSGSASSALALEIGVARTITVTVREVWKSATTYTLVVTRMPMVATPTFSVPSGPVMFGSTVEIASATSDAVIHFTTNGDTPTAVSAVYSGPITINSAVTLKAIALKDGFTNSSVASVSYTQAVVETPTINPSSGPIVFGSTVAIASATNGAAVYLTMDGSEPTTSSVLYDGPVAIESALTLKAIAVKAGYVNSGVASASYTQAAAVAAPTFSQPAGPIVFGSTVSMSSTSGGAAIYYTMDGTEPTTRASLYAGPVTITNPVTLRAIAVKDGYTNSAVASVSYTQAVAAMPFISPASGPIVFGSTVTITSATSGAAIYYTLDGLDPTTSSSVFGGPITINDAVTVKAMAVMAGYANSDVAGAVYTQAEAVATPTFSVPAGPVVFGSTVAITSMTDGASIRYTTNGDTPTSSATLYSGPITINSAMTLKAIALRNGYTNSAIASVSYTQATVATPSISPSSGPIVFGSTVTMTSATNGAAIYYTLSGAEPTTGSLPYAGPIVINDAVTVKAIAVKTGYANSAIASAAYTQADAVATPTFSVPAGPVVFGSTVEITSATNDAVIHFTTNGDTPTVGSAVYSGPITINSAVTLKAIALKDGFTNSAVASVSYMQVVADAPSFSPTGGSIVFGSTVTMTSSTSGADIYYTVDGSTPTTGSAKYAAPLPINSALTLKAMAVKAGYANSGVTSASYSQAPAVATPTFSQPAGPVMFGSTVSVSTATDGASIYYTMDGSEPSVSSTRYTVPIAINSAFTLKAIAIKDGYTSSAVASAAYTQAVAEAPSFTPSGGAIVFGSSVTITSATSGADIYYTMDGSTPSTGSTKYAGPVVINSAVTLKAVAVKSGYANSAVASASYSQAAAVATPTFSVPEGPVVFGSTVSISSMTEGASIRYTTNGDDPTAGSTLYTGPIEINSAMVLKAIAVKDGFTSSAVASASYTQAVVEAPSFTPSGGAIVFGSSVTITSATSGADIYYTMDGSTPSTGSTKYAGPVMINSAVTLKAMAVKTGYANSSVSSASYSQAQVVETPAFSLPAGPVVLGTTVTITSATSGAAIHYTTNGDIPTVGSTLYSGPITISSAMTLKAIAVKDGFTNSSVASAAYTQAVAEAPSFSPSGGAIVFGSSVTITSATSGADIYYTMDGSTPSTGSTKYAGPVVINGAVTLKAIAVKSGYANSAVTSASYSQAAAVATPTFSVPAGPIVFGSTVEITSATSGAAIYFTTNGDDPTAGSTLYTGPIAINSAFTLKAIAIKDGYTNSGVASASYSQAIVATPSFSPSGGAIVFGSTVTITSGTSGASIHYTTDGTTPTAGSPLYSGPITINNALTLMAIAVKSGYTNSAIASATYTQAEAVAAPTFTPSGGAVVFGSTVSISTTTSGASIYYTVNGDTPTASSTPYTGPITINSAITLKAIAVKSGYTNSAVLSASFSQAVVETPTFSPVAGPIAFGSTVTITSATGGATIYYTVDGSTPTISSTRYTGAITINSAVTVKAIAVKTGYANSSLASAAYTQAVSADLTGLALSAGKAVNGYSFSPSTYVYTGITTTASSITVTPTGTGIITVNGTTVLSGASLDVALGGTSSLATITVVVTETGKSSKTYSLTVTRQ